MPFWMKLYFETVFCRIFAIMIEACSRVKQYQVSQVSETLFQPNKSAKPIIIALRLIGKKPPFAEKKKKLTQNLVIRCNKKEQRIYLPLE